MKESKKSFIKMIVLAIIPIVLAIVLFSGATFSYFTNQKSSGNMMITAGKIKMQASAELKGAFSARSSDNGYERNYDLISENDVFYFTNGGAVAYDAKSNIINIANITPGDGFDVEISITNYSTVKSKYCVAITVLNNDSLTDALIFSCFGNTYTSKDDITSEWIVLDAVNNPNTSVNVDPFNVTIELPVEVDDLYQDLSCQIVINVLAMQLSE